MIKQSENVARIEGILSEVSVETKTFERDGKPIDAITATLKIKVHQEINSIPYDMEVPVYMFATKVTKSGSINPAYKSIEKVQNEYVSIASGGLAAADRVRISRGDIRMNEFYDPNGRLVSLPRVNASFIDRVPKVDSTIDEATFVMTIVVGDTAEEFDREGDPTGRLNIRGISIGYGERADVIPFKVAAPNAISHIRSYWNEGDTVKVKGSLHFTSETIYTVEEVGFGDPIRTPKTVFVSDLIIESGSASGIDGDDAYTQEDVQKLLTDRKVRLETLKEKAANQASSSSGSAQTSKRGTSKISDTLKF